MPKFGLDNLGENRPVPGLTVIDEDETFCVALLFV